MPFQNYTSILRDMQMAGKISNENLVSYVAKNPLPMFKYPVKKRFTFDCDIMSTCMLPSGVSEDYCVAYTKGDGTCLYNALSQHLSGGYSYANELRCRVAYQLIMQNQVYYDAAKECTIMISHPRNISLMLPLWATSAIWWKLWLLPMC